MGDLTVRETIVQATASQNLATSSLSFTTSFSEDFRLISIFFKFTGAVSQTITVTLDSVQGSSYDTVIGTVTLSSNTSVQFVPIAVDQDFKDGDELLITCTNTGTPAITVNLVVSVELR